jgi:hypothetical protein
MRTPIFAAALGMFFVAHAAHANLLVNGNFAEDPPARGCAAGITSLPGWTVTNNVDIDVVINASCSPGEPPPGGGPYLDLTGSYAEDGTDDRGTVSQTVATHAGATYDLSFYFGGNSQWQCLGYPNDGAIKSMDVLLNDDVIGTYSVNTAGASCSDGRFKLENIDFTATTDETTLSFESLNGEGIDAPSDFGPLLADVNLEQVPEPATFALLAMGLAAIGYTRRRNRCSRLLS